MAMEKLRPSTLSTATPTPVAPASVTTSSAATPRTPQESLAYGFGLVFQGRGQPLWVNIVFSNGLSPDSKYIIKPDKVRNKLYIPLVQEKSTEDTDILAMALKRIEELEAQVNRNPPADPTMPSAKDGGGKGKGNRSGEESMEDPIVTPDGHKVSWCQ